MFFQPNERIEEVCVRLLGEKPGQNAAELHGQIAFTCTLQSVYKELKKLSAQGVLVRKRGRYFLQASWLMKMHQMTSSFYEEFLSDSLSEELLPAEGTSLKWKFRTLIDFDDFWGHLLVVLLQETDSKILFEFVSHPWFELIHHHKENLFRDTLRSLDKKIYMSLADDSFLTRRCLQSWTRDVSQFSTSAGPFESKIGSIIDVIGPFVVESQLSPKLQRGVAEIFERVDSSRKINSGEILEVFREKASIRVSIVNNPIKAQRVRRKFIDFFGLTKEEQTLLSP